MKLILSAIFATSLFIPIASAAALEKPATPACDCEKGKVEKEKKEEGTVAGNCGGCEGKEKDKKEEGTVAGNCGGCEGKEKDKKEEGTVAGNCGGCEGKEKDKKEEGTVA